MKYRLREIVRDIFVYFGNVIYNNTIIWKPDNNTNTGEFIIRDLISTAAVIQLFFIQII